MVTGVSIEKPAKNLNFWHHRPISCFDPAAQPINNQSKLFGRKLSCLNLTFWTPLPPLVSSFYYIRFFTTSPTDELPSLPTLSFLEDQIQKKIFSTTDAYFHVKLMQGIQKYELILNPTSLFGATS